MDRIYYNFRRILKCKINDEDMTHDVWSSVQDNVSMIVSSIDDNTRFNISHIHYMLCNNQSIHNSIKKSVLKTFTSK